MASELKPCPFCGKTATVLEVPKGLNGAGLYVVGCTVDDMCMGNINHLTMLFYTQESAIEHWNKRADGLFDCLTDKQKEKGKRKGIRKAKREDRIAKIINWFNK